MRKVVLKVVYGNGITLSDKDYVEYCEECAVADSEAQLPPELQARSNARGEVLSYRRTLIAMTDRAIDPNAGMSFDEMVLSHKLRIAQESGSVYLTQPEMDTLTFKVKRPFLTQYHAAFYEMMDSVLNSPVVLMVEKE